MKHYDLIIIGSGGGSKLTPAAQLGKKVAMIEKGAMGGTCLNRGCIPSKRLIHLADKMQELQRLKHFYVELQNPDFSFDWDRYIQEVSAHVDGHSKDMEDWYKKSESVDFYQGEATFSGKKEIEVNGEKLTADVILVATGSRPLIPQIPGLEGTPYLTSTEALRLTKKPKKLIVIGGGYIALELGHFYHSLGVETEYLVRSSMLKGEDETIQGIFDQKFCSENKVYKGVEPDHIEYKYGQFFVHSKKGGQTFVGDALLVATGIVPNSDRLNLDKTGVKTDKKGFIKVDQHLQTDCEGVYAIGDVVGHYLFRHSVNFEAEYLMEQLFFADKKTAIQYPPMPHAVFTHPQIAGVGMTEQEIKKENQRTQEPIDYIAVTHEYSKTGMGSAMKDEGLVKILVDKKTHKILGAHIIGQKSSDIIHSLIAQMTLGATVEQCLAMIYIHPALSEVIKGALRKAVTQLS
ncbi:MAG TPA: dihydrolipoyl dehydrogenase [Candidatus Gracilibacteria bacterium]